MDENVEKLQQQEPPEKKHRASAWIVLLTVFYGLSIFAAAVVIIKTPSARKPLKIDAGDIRSVSDLIRKKDGVGWVTIKGGIYDSEGSGPWEKGLPSWRKKIQSLSENKEVKALVVEINSGGGSIGAVQELYDAIKRVRTEKKKPVVALMGDVAASGGYYIAAACDHIIAHPGTLTGSIGVIMNTGSLEGLLNKLGVKSDPVKSGRFKDIGSPFRNMTPDERKLLQDVIDDSYDQFLTVVSEGRKIPREELRGLADGRIFTGRQALAVKLVDSLGGSREAADKAAELAKIEKPPRIIKDAEPWEQIISLLDSKFSGGIFGMLGLGGDADRMLRPRIEYRWPD